MMSSLVCAVIYDDRLLALLSKYKYNIILANTNAYPEQREEIIITSAGAWAAAIAAAQRQG